MIGVSTYCVDGNYIIIATFYLEEEKEGKMLMRLCTFIFFFFRGETPESHSMGYREKGTSTIVDIWACY